MARVAFILDTDFEDSEFQVPYDEVRRAGHEAVIVGLEAGKQVEGKKGKVKTKVEKTVKDVRAEDFDALVIPGGYSPDHLRADDGIVKFTRTFNDQDKPIAAICHAPWMLAEADIIDGRTVTSFPSIKTDLVNAGAKWVDRELVEDGNLLTSRNPHDLPVFCEAILRHLSRAAARHIAGGEGEVKPHDAGAESAPSLQ